MGKGSTGAAAGGGAIYGLGIFGALFSTGSRPTRSGSTSGRSSRKPSFGRRSWSTRGSGRSARNGHLGFTDVSAKTAVVRAWMNLHPGANHQQEPPSNLHREPPSLGPELTDSSMTSHAWDLIVASASTTTSALRLPGLALPLPAPSRRMMIGAPAYPSCPRIAPAGKTVLWTFT
jgi:hypothetical protein